MPEGFPLTTLIKAIMGAIGACQMPSLPSQLTALHWTQLLRSGWQAFGGQTLKHMECVHLPCVSIEAGINLIIMHTYSMAEMPGDFTSALE